MIGRFGVLTIATLALSADASAQSSTSGDLPENAHEVKASQIRFLFEQCSRYAPAFAPTTYRLLPEDVVKLESELPAALERALADRGYGTLRRVTFDPSTYLRSDASYDADGRAMIYGSFEPIDSYSPKSPPSLGLVCDGGPRYFGVEYDVELQEITQISFNGET